MKHVLVTGGAGFIGSHVVERLLARGYAVTVADDLSTGRRENLAAAAERAGDRLRLVVVDVSQPFDAAIATDRTIDHILHLAAQVSVQRSIVNPLDDMAKNLGATLAVLAFARARGAGRVVYASSAAVYGDGPLPAEESGPCRPLSPYGVHKLASEHHLRLAAEAAAPSGLDTASCRFFNVFGPRQVPGSEYAGVIAVFLARAAACLPLSVHGDGSATRDFVYVGDVARALVAVLEAPGRLGGALVNVGTGHETTIAELAHVARELGGGEAEITFGPERHGDIRRSVAAIDRLRALGWAPETGLREGLAATYAWLVGVES